MTSLPERGNIISLVAKAILAGARQGRAYAAIDLIPRTLQRWPVGPSRGDLRPGREQTPTNKLTLREREHLLNVVNSDEFGSLPPSQIVPILADRGQYLVSESTIYRVMRDENQLWHRGADATFAPEKPSCRTRWCCIPTMAAR
ncbi:hypothetical protein [Candidatus Nitrotoga sp. 1052]|uniref:hypothetical protein n=1 Tax=Candidatus Nitrotoga sp. 1052 TaxID=2886964 RepID=UPI001EF60150|nr:hypothetical protein [Candidatus Nitrotoga sp. 1052]CAH1075462.1 hypothetical protein NTG1052_260015 [Candidatus Nitrotoga sp. 1052]